MQIKFHYILILLFSFWGISLFAQNNSLEVQFNKTLTPEQRKAYKDEIQKNSQKIRENPENYIYYLRRGVAYSNLGLNPDAITDYNKVIKIRPDVPEAYYNRGVARARFRYTKISCQDIKKAADLGLDNAVVLYQKKCQLYFKDLGDIK